MSFDAAEVRSYYDRHTIAFVTYGQGKDIGAIHRAVWAPGVRDRRAAFQYVDSRIADLAKTLPRPTDGLHIVDLGCGVGASLRYLAAHLPVRGTGVTLSPVQVEIAAARNADARLGDRLRCIEADFCHLPADIEPADIAYAIESFVHAASAERFFDQCRRLVRPGGLLIICDDFLGTDLQVRPDAARTVNEFRAGWHVNTLVTPADVRAHAHAAGFTHVATDDLTPYLELGRARDRVIGAMLWVGRRLGLHLQRFDDLTGGHALQTGLRRGWIRYELTVFRAKD
jgi:SAM-dependent methyltransferase